MKYIFIFLSIFVFLPVADAQNWNPVAGGMNSHVRALFADTIDNVLYVGGRFSYADGIEVNGIAAWDGHTFNSLGSGHDGCSIYNCPSSFRNIVRYQDEIYCANFGYSIGGVPIKGIARWDGVTWDSVGTGITGSTGDGGLVWGMLVHEDELYIYGRFTFGGGVASYGIVKWNGQEYIPMGFPYAPPTANNPQIVDAIIFQDELYVGGQFAAAFTVEDQVDIARFDGENWHSVGGGIIGTIGDVNELTIYKEELYIGGNFRKSSGNAGTGIMKLKDDEWVDVGGGFDSPTTVVHQMVVYHDELYVFGLFDSVGGGIRADNAAKWDGHKWCGLGGESNGRIEKATVFKDSIFIGGGFQTIDNDSFLYLAKWHGDFIDTCGQPVIVQNPSNLSKLVSIYPNPVNSEIYLTIDFNLKRNEKTSINIYSYLGQKMIVEELPLSTNNHIHQIDVSNLPSGLYLLTLEAAGQIWTEKVIIQ